MTDSRTARWAPGRRHTDGGDLSVSAFAGLKFTTAGLRGVVDDTAGIYVEDQSPIDENRYRARFYFDPNSFDTGEALSHFRTRLFVAFEENPTRRLAAIVLRRIGGQYALLGRARLDDNSQYNTGFFPISDGAALRGAGLASGQRAGRERRVFRAVDRRRVRPRRHHARQQPQRRGLRAPGRAQREGGRERHDVLGRVRVAPAGRNRARSQESARILHPWRFPHGFGGATHEQTRRGPGRLLCSLARAGGPAGRPRPRVPGQHVRHERPGFPSVAMDADGNFAVVWHSRDQDGHLLGVFARFYDPSGAPVEPSDVQVNTFTPNDQAGPRVAASASGEFVVVWTSFGQDGASGSVFARRFDAAGGALGAEFPVNAYTTGLQTGAAVAMEPLGNFVVVWHGAGADGYAVWARRFSAGGVPAGGEFRVNSYTSPNVAWPSVASDGGGSSSPGRASSRIPAALPASTPSATTPGRAGRAGVQGELPHHGPPVAAVGRLGRGWPLRRRLEQLWAGPERLRHLRPAVRRRGHAARGRVRRERERGRQPDPGPGRARPARRVHRRVGQLRAGRQQLRRLRAALRRERRARRPGLPGQRPHDGLPDAPGHRRERTWRLRGGVGVGRPGRRRQRCLRPALPVRPDLPGRLRRRHARRVVRAARPTAATSTWPAWPP